eukprot:2649544-Pyramimonas_sp.AAC.2
MLRAHVMMGWLAGHCAAQHGRASDPRQHRHGRAAGGAAALREHGEAGGALPHHRALRAGVTNNG